MKNHWITYLLPCFLFLLTGCSSPLREPAPKAVSTATTAQASPGLLDSLAAEILVAEPVPHRITRNIIEDNQGNIWIASWDGIYKYAGNEFNHFTDGVSTDRFIAVLEDSKGHFWFVSVNTGLYFYDGQTFKNYTVEDGLPSNRTADIYEDKNGHFWISTEAGLSFFNGQSFRNFTIDDGLPDNRVNSVVEDKNGLYWIGTRGHTTIYNPMFSTFTDVVDADGNKFLNAREIIVDSHDHVWLAGESGLWRYNQFEFKIYSNSFTGFIFEDNEGNILSSSGKQPTRDWILTRFENATSSMGQVTATELIKDPGILFGILKDQSGDIWYGTFNGVYRFDGQQIYHYMNQ